MQWGVGNTVSNYTTTVNLPITVAIIYVGIAIGIVSPTDTIAKTISCVMSNTTTKTMQFRTELAVSPSIRWIAIGK